MVSYYNSTTMYRHQQAVTAPNGPQFHHQAPMHSWYAAAGYHHHQAPQMGAAPPPTTYCMQEEQQMWHPHHSHPHHHTVFHDFSEFPAHPAPNPVDNQDGHQLSPPITVSGSEMSSPGAANEASSPVQPPHHHHRPTPARSPYEWIKKTSYQTQATTPGRTRTKDKYRIVYTDAQRLELEKEFQFNNKYITIRRKTELAKDLGLSERQIKIWFQNRRAKDRKQYKKHVEELNNKNHITVDNYQQQRAYHLPHQQMMDPLLMINHQSLNHQQCLKKEQEF